MVAHFVQFGRGEYIQFWEFSLPRTLHCRQRLSACTCERSRSAGVGGGKMDTGRKMYSGRFEKTTARARTKSFIPTVHAH